MHVKNIHLGQRFFLEPLRFLEGTPIQLLVRKRELCRLNLTIHIKQLELHQAGGTPSPAVLFSDNTDMGQDGSSYCG